jgi:multisubunit Na+/H+ antiporter MnhG subunit
MLLVRLLPTVATLGIAVATAFYADAHSWSDGETQGALAAVIGASVALDFLISWLRDRARAARGANQRRDLAK